MEIIHYQIIVITSHEMTFDQNSFLDCLFGSAPNITVKIRAEISLIKTSKQDCKTKVLAFVFDTYDIYIKKALLQRSREVRYQIDH